MKLIKLNEGFSPYDMYGGRKQYLEFLADEYAVPYDVVMTLASTLGPEEDFDALVTEVEEYADSHFDLDEDFNGNLTRKQIRELNKICLKYCGWKLPQEIRPLWNELEEYGVDIGMISGYPDSVAQDGGKSWSNYFTYNGEIVKNSMFIYQVYEGNGDSLKNEYNIYFS